MKSVLETGRSTRYNTPSMLKPIARQEEENLFEKRPGFTFGVSTRLDPKKWDFHQIRTWPKCSFY